LKLALFRHVGLRPRAFGKWFRGFGLGGEFGFEGGGFFGLAGGLEALEVERGLVVGPLNAGDLAVEAGQAFVIAAVGVAEFGAGIVAADGAAAFDGTGPNLGFGGAETAEAPGVFEQMVDEFAFGSVGRLPAVGELLGEGAELVGVFAGDDDGGGVDAGFEGIEADGFFAVVGRGSGGFLRISSIGFDLFNGCHCCGAPTRFDCCRRVQGNLGVLERRD